MGGRRGDIPVDRFAHTTAGNAQSHDVANGVCDPDPLPRRSQYLAEQAVLQVYLEGNAKPAGLDWVVVGVAGRAYMRISPERKQR